MEEKVGENLHACDVTLGNDEYSDCNLEKLLPHVDFNTSSFLEEVFFNSPNSTFSQSEEVLRLQSNLFRSVTENLPYEPNRGTSEESSGNRYSSSSSEGEQGSGNDKNDNNDSIATSMSGEGCIVSMKPVSSGPAINLANIEELNSKYYKYALCKSFKNFNSAPSSQDISICLYKTKGGIDEIVKDGIKAVVVGESEDESRGKLITTKICFQQNSYSNDGCLFYFTIEDTRGPVTKRLFTSSTFKLIARRKAGKKRTGGGDEEIQSPSNSPKKGRH